MSDFDVHAFCCMHIFIGIRSSGRSQRSCAARGKKFESASASRHGMAVGIVQPFLAVLGILPLSRTVDILHKYGFSMQASSYLKGSQKAPPQRPCCAAIAHIGQSLRQAAPGQLLRF